MATQYGWIWLIDDYYLFTSLYNWVLGWPILLPCTYKSNIQLNSTGKLNESCCTIEQYAKNTTVLEQVSFWLNLPIQIKFVICILFHSKYVPHFKRLNKHNNIYGFVFRFLAENHPSWTIYPTIMVNWSQQNSRTNQREFWTSLKWIYFKVVMILCTSNVERSNV